MEMVLLVVFVFNLVAWKLQKDQLLEEFKITRFRKSPSIALSGGERRRCEIARALASRPSFFVPTLIR